MNVAHLSAVAFSKRFSTASFSTVLSAQHLDSDRHLFVLNFTGKAKRR